MILKEFRSKLTAPGTLFKIIIRNKSQFSFTEGGDNFGLSSALAHQSSLLCLLLKRIKNLLKFALRVFKES